MNRLTWFRAYARMVDDDKLRLLAFEDRWHFVALMCCKAQGLLDERGALMRRKVAVKLEIDLGELDEVVRRLADAGLIDRRTFAPLAWDEGSDDLRPPAHEWRGLRSTVFARDDYTCQYCGARGGQLECDHVVPVSRGGSHALANLATACKPCNRSKRAKTPDEWLGRNGVGEARP